MKAIRFNHEGPAFAERLRPGRHEEHGGNVTLHPIFVRLSAISASSACRAVTLVKAGGEKWAVLRSQRALAAASKVRSRSTESTKSSRWRGR